jgi:transposase
MQRRQFTAEFKAEAVRQALKPGVSKTKVAQDLQIHSNVLRKWVRLAKGDAQAPRAIKAGESAAELARENQRLQKELARVKMERDILKKATAYFAKESL